MRSTGAPTAAGTPTAPDRPPLPAGFRISLDPASKRLAGDLLFGGSPARVLRLSAAGVACYDRLVTHPVDSAATGRLARLLTDAGIAHPRPPQSAMPAGVTVIVPVHERAAMLDRCLAALAADQLPVIVVDDGSTDRAGIAAAAGRHGARLIRLERNRGPAAARNLGLDSASTELVAFIDSDCIAEPGWIEQLRPHFADPAVAAVAPRVVPLAGSGSAGAYSASNSSLDLGAAEALVRPGSRVGYLPTAALLVRRAALADQPFDEQLRVGEDVDLIWRLVGAGWRVRYEPRVRVGHDEPADWPGLLARRFRYGTSAAGLGRRHPAAIAPLRLHLLPALTVAAALGRRPVLAGLGLASAIASTTLTLRRAEVPTAGVLPASWQAVRQTWLGVGRYSTQLAAPLLIAGLLRPGRRLAVASLLFGPPLTAWFDRRPRLDPARYAIASIADDLAYGAGVWTGCLAERDFSAIRPSVQARPFRIHRQRGGYARPAAQTAP